MKLKDIPIIIGVDEVRIYRGNELLNAKWINGAAIHWFFNEDILTPYVDCEIDSLEMVTSESSNIIVCEIWLKAESS